MNVPGPLDLDLFCGAGGAAAGMAAVGVETVGFDYDADACATHAAAGFPTVQCDLATWHWPTELRGQVRLMWASPPCQPFSIAGDRRGEHDPRDGIPHWLRAVAAIRPEYIIMENVRGLSFEKHERYRHAFRTALHLLGYRTDWRVLDAADYSVPQRRHRFILLGTNGPHALPWPTPSASAGGLLGSWQTMADAIGWGLSGRPSVAIAGASEKGGPHHTEVDRGWWMNRPATTLAADPRVFAPGGHHANDGRRPGFPGRSENAIQLTQDEAARLQGFPAGYPFQGGKTSVARQIGNAVPAPMAAAIVAALLGLEPPPSGAKQLPNHPDRKPRDVNTGGHL